MTVAAVHRGVRAVPTAVTQVFLYHPSIYRKAIARTKDKRSKLRDFSIRDWKEVTLGREPAKEMMSMKSNGSNPANQGNNHANNGNNANQPHGSISHPPSAV